MKHLLPTLTLSLLLISPLMYAEQQDKYLEPQVETPTSHQTKGTKNRVRHNHREAKGMPHASKKNTTSDEPDAKSIREKRHDHQDMHK